MLEISFINSLQHQQILHGKGQLEIGSESKLDGDSRSFCVQDARISSRQMALEEVSVDSKRCLQIDNFGQSVMLPTGQRLFRESQLILDLPVKFWVGNTCFHVSDLDAQPIAIDQAIRTLPTVGESVEAAKLVPAISIESLGVSPSSATLHQWFESLGRLQRSIAGTQEFFDDAAYAVFDPGGFDAGMVLKYDKSEWSISSSFVPDYEFGFWFRESVLDQMLKNRRTVFHDANLISGDELSEGQVVIAASPVFDEENEIVGAIYGLRLHHAKNNRLGVRPLEAQFVQLIADSVTAGLIRLHRESEVVRTQVMFEQVFPSSVAAELQRDPTILDGHERNVSILFCDMRGFTSIAERLDSKITYQLLSDVLNYLTAQVAKHDGVIIDYYGDGLAAFWNAPMDQPDHPLLACKTAVEMIKGFPAVWEDWHALVGHPLHLGIGIHTGDALIGNSGSDRRLKYGPRGTTVNIASRLENATKEFNVPILVSETTAKAVEQEMYTRRLFKTELPGLKTKIPVYQIFNKSIDIEKIERIRNYEEALNAFENDDFETARRLLETEQADSADRFLRERLK